MAGFDSGGFDAGGFDAGAGADITTGLARIVAESLEIANATRLTRIATEVVQEFPATLVELHRIVTEVIQQDAFVPPNARAEVHRIVTEVIGFAAEVVGKEVKLTRAMLEVIASQVLKHRGFGFAGIPVNAVTIAYSIDLELTQAGFWGLQGANGDGYSLTWASASPSTITETWRNGATVVTNTFAAPAGRLTRRFTTAAASPGVSFIDLASLRPDDRAGSGVLQELMVWDRQLTGPEAARIDAYLTCKWVTPGCQPAVSAPFPACV